MDWILDAIIDEIEKKPQPIQLHKSGLAPAAQRYINVYRSGRAAVQIYG